MEALLEIQEVRNERGHQRCAKSWLLDQQYFGLSMMAFKTIPIQADNSAKKTLKAFTLTEVVIAISIMGLVCAGIISAYIQTTRHVEWSAYSLAAQALSTRELEQARAARWDLHSSPAVDETVTIPTTSATILDLPVSGTNVVWAVNHFSVSNLTVSTTPLVRFKVVRVDTVWPFGDRLFTNTTITYRAPDQ
jgi:prepilin-type N-terminal cleavage/methylation domain-containing protein